MDELSLEVGASIGVARFPRDGEDAHALLRCADVAMYAAKEAQRRLQDLRGRARPALGPPAERAVSDFRRALDRDEIVVHYQPIVDIDGSRVRGAEALVRWQHPSSACSRRRTFMQIVEQTGLIGPLTRHVLERAVAECARWRRGRPGADGGGQPVGPQPARPDCCRARSSRTLDRYSAAAGGAAARDHREHDHVGSRAGDRRPSRGSVELGVAARRSTTSAPATRRWPTCAAADRRAQDRPVVRLADARATRAT